MARSPSRAEAHDRVRPEGRIAVGLDLRLRCHRRANDARRWRRANRHEASNAANAAFGGFPIATEQELSTGLRSLLRLVRRRRDFRHGRRCRSALRMRASRRRQRRRSCLRSRAGEIVERRSSAALSGNPSVSASRIRPRGRSSTAQPPAGRRRTSRVGGQAAVRLEPVEWLLECAVERRERRVRAVRAAEAVGV